jgi:hypothetical protein
MFAAVVDQLSPPKEIRVNGDVPSLCYGRTYDASGEGVRPVTYVKRPIISFGGGQFLKFFAPRLLPLT